MIFGLAGMLGLWWLAWQVLQRPALDDSNQTAIHPPVWQNEPTPASHAPGEPPGWLFEEDAAPGSASEAADVVSPRGRADSSENTQFFTREQLDDHAEKTEIIDPDGVELEGPAPPPPPPPPSAHARPPSPVTAKTRKTWLMTSSQVPPPPPKKSPPREVEQQPEAVVPQSRGGGTSPPPIWHSKDDER